MNLYILRHGQAESIGDQESQLTETGKLETYKVASWLKSQNTQVDLIFSSPKQRAQQTAQIFKEELPVAEPIQIIEDLKPNKKPENILPLLDGAAFNNILIASHMPFVGRLLHALIANDDEKAIPFEPSGLACVELAEIKYGSGELRWVVHPGLL